MDTSSCCISSSTHPSTLSFPKHSSPHRFHAHIPTATAYNHFASFEPQIFNQALALLQQSGSHNTPPRIPNPESSTTSLFTPHPTRPRSTLPPSVATHDWQTQQMSAGAYNGMGGATHYNQQQQSEGLKHQRSHHQRTPSASTIASTGPASPYLNAASYPGSVDQASSSAAKYADQAAFFTKNLPTPSHTPTDSLFANTPSYTSSAHLAMKNLGFDYHSTDDFASDFAPSRQSMSSYGNDSPATPQSGAGDVETKNYSISQNGEIENGKVFDWFNYSQFDDADLRQSNPNVQLFRTESQAFQDELYNPHQVYTSAPTKSQNQQMSLLSPHRNLITERLQTANLARSASPSSVMSRERSPFRESSEYTRDWRAADGKVGTAASMRQQQKDEATQAEYAQHRAPLRREPTKTISPKDALLEYNGDDQTQAPLFQDSIPTGYKQHLGGTEQWPTNNYISQPSTAFQNLQSTGQQNMSFRNATSADNGFAGNAFDFTSLPQGSDSLQNPFQAGNYQAAVAAKMNNLSNMNNYSESAPAFPASIPSMETSISDAGLPNSSQESATISTPQRPADTRANTGTYTCTYHGCTQRFNTHNDLQKHKRDYHRSQQKQQHDTASASETASTSPRSTGSPDSSGNGMTSAAILARNSQAGPHKCTRINPSTGKPCNTIFSRPYDLTRHEDTIHNGRKQKVRCPMCREEKTFSRNDALTRHMRVVHPEVESFGKRRRGD